ncbi:AI-2E family transporter [Candidatus Woesearchaeota archaeon]|jgi:predicted PurR-regulated permease PerM|nr:AI-2E family transporter [Candidatus Woesearchaeota archaeon]MBT5272395.1 AI-2E family transporter [Candidatus Woesearchaeota archaeon]MBT6041270.1 AI-2E family transporter [Candidatus Woesearchaeota archaeon]MBT6336667.1 AI-2E family transporter [Candidatus Woesearchaeota archaeon]MBT7927557.1 AI-2E family transporter [Candidatus Woesearchaeota archaeon]
MVKKSTFDQKEYKKFLFYVMFIILLIASYLIIKDWLITILNAMILVMIFYPAYEYLDKKIKKKAISSLVITIGIILLIALPTGFMINSLVKETSGVYNSLKDKFEGVDFRQKDCDTLLCKINKQVDNAIYEYNLKDSIVNAFEAIGKTISQISFDFIIGIPSKIIGFLIMILMIFYLFLDGKRVLEFIEIPLTKVQQNKVIKHIRDTIYGVVYGQVIIAILQGVVGAIGLMLVGFHNPVLFGVIMAILALLPIVGASFVWVPASLYLIITGILTSNTWILGKGIFLLLYSGIIINAIELFVKPKLIGQKAGLHPLIVLVGILGGIKLFGFGGLILGPVILSIVIKILEMYKAK